MKEDFYRDTTYKARIDAYLKEFTADPAHWTNNKRRRHGLPVLRKEANRKCRTVPQVFMKTVFIAVEEILEDVIPKQIENTFECFADVKQFEL